MIDSLNVTMVQKGEERKGEDTILTFWNEGYIF
jgi:hypothetical protein